MIGDFVFSLFEKTSSTRGIGMNNKLSMIHYKLSNNIVSFHSGKPFNNRVYFSNPSITRPMTYVFSESL